MKVILEAQHACTPTPRGIAYYTVQLIQQLLDRGAFNYELTFFDYGRERGNFRWVNQYFGRYGAPIHECGRMDYREMSAKDSVFDHMSYNEYTGTAGDIFYFSHFVSIPASLQGRMVLTVHDMISFLHPEYFKPAFLPNHSIALKRIQKMRPRIAAVSEASRRDVLEITGLPEENVVTVYEAYDNRLCFPKKDPRATKAFGIQGEYLLYLGAMENRKNIIRVVEAFERFAGRYKGLQLVVAGGREWQTDQILQRIGQSPVHDRIVVTGYITDEQKRALYSGALGFVFPSLYEGFGIPVLEAMACGCPVITSNVSSLPEVAGDAAVLIDPYDVGQLAFEMERVVHSDAVRCALSEKGLEQCKRFSWEKTARQMEKLFIK